MHFFVKSMRVHSYCCMLDHPSRVAFGMATQASCSVLLPPLLQTAPERCGWAFLCEDRHPADHQKMKLHGASRQAAVAAAGWLKVGRVQRMEHPPRAAGSATASAGSARPAHFIATEGYSGTATVPYVVQSQRLARAMVCAPDICLLAAMHLTVAHCKMMQAADLMMILRQGITAAR